MAKKNREKEKHKAFDASVLNQKEPNLTDSENMAVPPEGDDGMSVDSGDGADELTQAKAEYDTLNDKYLRLYSDFDNYRKRTMRERAELLKTASSGLITQLLPVLDDFDRANRSFQISDDYAALKAGVDLIYNKFKNILAQKGLEEIKAVGELFDTDLHEAITNLPSPSDEMKGKVLDEIEKGYTLNGTVIRFAKVAVAN
jgi:molecular chaperone GrpE